MDNDGKKWRFELKDNDPVKNELLGNLVKDHYQRLPKQQFEYSKPDYHLFQENRKRLDDGHNRFTNHQTA